MQPQEGRITGSGGCNPFIATYEMSGGDLRIGSIDSGLRLCFDTGLAEGLYLEALRAAEHYRIEGRQLVLARADGPGKEKGPAALRGPRTAPEVTEQGPGPFTGRQ